MTARAVARRHLVRRHISLPESEKSLLQASLGLFLPKWPAQGNAY
jgi:hypothetical protein